MSATAQAVRVALLAAALSAAAGAQQITAAYQSADLQAALASARQAVPTPALAAAVVVDGVVYYAIDGVRRADWFATGANIAQVDDQFIIGSVSKPITSAALAIAVDRGMLSWNTTLGQLIPGIFPGTQGNRYANNTLAELMSHSAGLWYSPAGMPAGDLLDDPYLSDYSRRFYYTYYATADAPVCDSEQCGNYDGGHIIGAHLFETATGEDFAAFMIANVFAPLGMSHTQTEWTCDASLQSWIANPHLMMHGTDSSGNFIPQGYSHSIRWMVGGISASILDLARFAYAAMYSPNATSHLWSAASNGTLTTNVGRSGYPPSWEAINSLDGAGGLELFHNGTYGAQNINMRIWPNRRVAIITANSALNDANGRVEAFIENNLTTLFGAVAASSVDPLANELPTTIAASVNQGDVWRLNDGHATPSWSSIGPVTNAVLTLTPASGSTFAPFTSIFVDEQFLKQGPSNVPGFVPVAGSTQGTPYQAPINSVTLKIWTPTSRTPSIITDNHVGPRRRFLVGHRLGVSRVDIVFSSTGEARLAEVALLP